MNFNYFAIIFITVFNVILTLKVKQPLIFGRRMTVRDSVVRKALISAGIVPDVIESVPKNISLVQVQYPGALVVRLGNELMPKSVKDQPSVEWPSEEGQYYTLVMTDPDVPTRKEPIDGEVKHWLVINIPGAQVSSGEALAVYRGSAPPSGSGLHRYVFLVYKQRQYLNHTEPVLNTTSREGRTHFKVSELAKKYDLGEPIGANYYVAQYDDYVGLIRARLQEKTSVKSDNLRAGMKSRRSQLSAIDWARKTPKVPKFPQMVCLKYDKYLKIQNMLKSYNLNINFDSKL